MTHKQDEWKCKTCHNIYGRHDQWFNGTCETCNEDKEQLKIKKAVIRELKKFKFTQAGAEALIDKHIDIYECYRDDEATSKSIAIQLNEAFEQEDE